GVLLLNTVLTVDSGCAASHAKRFGWENFSDAVIRALSDRGGNISFILWGNFAASKRPLIDEGKHLVISSAHPSPLSARKGFFGSRPFSRVSSRTGIDWRLEP
ncbi:MAG: uracil-DNA glycosylase, partial [Lentisphaeria bacterium]|nr:uracil-DNA glycosylase [Lentisphaeria bacterium]